jgi:hypothetical protein
MLCLLVSQYTPQHISSPQHPNQSKKTVFIWQSRESHVDYINLKLSAAPQTICIKVPADLQDLRG